jgi:pimeloyl-ACP methyl ester carboxylesterase
MSLLYASRDSRVTTALGIMPSSGPVTGQRRIEWERNGIHISKRDLPENPNEYREFHLPFSHVLDRDKYDVVADMHNIHVPVLLLAGEKDISVLPEDVKELYDNANEPKRYIELKDIDHEYRHNPEEVEVVNGEIIQLISELA